MVGVGAMGAAACRSLAGRGCKVLGLERESIPNERGSHHGRSRMIRLAYYEHPDYVALLRRAWELWEELDRRAGGGVLFRTGGLYLGRPEAELLRGCRRAAEQHRLPHELLDGGELRRRFPQFRLPEDAAGFFEEQAGFLVPERAVELLAGQALENGAELHGGERVLSWICGGDGARVTTGRGEYFGKVLIFTAGAGSGALLGEVGVRLRVTRQISCWVWPRDGAQFLLGRFPSWAADATLAGLPGGLLYGFPVTADGAAGLGLKLAHHFPGEEVDWEKEASPPRPGEEQPLLAAAARVLPAAQGPLLCSKICYYTNSPDSHFVIDRHPLHPNVCLACGFSGHGFKFATVMGEILADLVTEGRSRLPVEFLSLRRFAR